MIRALLTTVIVAGTFANTQIAAYKADTVAAFLAPALLTNYLSSKRTIADVRAKAQAIIEEYEEHHAIFTVAEIRWAYEMVRCSDQEIENRLWWNNLLTSAFIGTFAALVYHSIMHPASQQAGPTIHNHHYPAADTCPRPEPIAAPFFNPMTK